MRTAIMLAIVALAVAVLAPDVRRMVEAIRNARRWHRLDRELRQRRGLR